MKIVFSVLTALTVAALSGLAQEVAPAEAEAVELPSDAEVLYQQAVSERELGEPKKAIQTAAEIVALHSIDDEVMPKAELLCAELYVEIGLLDAADVTARQVVALYKGTEVAETAAALRKQIELKKLEADTKSEGRTQ